MGELGHITSCNLELTLRYDHGLGALATYFEGLERGIAMATTCPACARTWFPPRLTCTCNARTPMAWRQLSGTGTVVAVTLCSTTLPFTTTRADFVFAIVQLEGAINRAFGRLTTALAPGTRVILTRADGDYAHPAQRCLFVPVASG
jgi:uncharacterized OB-fold protein